MAVMALFWVVESGEDFGKLKEHLGNSVIQVDVPYFYRVRWV